MLQFSFLEIFLKIYSRHFSVYLQYVAQAIENTTEKNRASGCTRYLKEFLFAQFRANYKSHARFTIFISLVY